MNQPSDEIKSRLDIVEVIRDYIQLKPAGINFRALCPFHREKTPSFMVSPEKQIWHCFGCQEGGDIFSFVMKMESVSFVEALRMLASKAGVKLAAQDPKTASQRNRLLDIVELSNKYYYKILTESGQAPPHNYGAGQAKAAREYLAERGLTEETIEEWRIGYSPDSWDDLIIFLKGKGYNENEIFLAGMSVKKEGTNRFYNRFRDRIMFPIFDAGGNAVAFSARVSPASAPRSEAMAGKPEKENEFKMGKYINSPQTIIYDKSKILFGLDKAKPEIKKQDLAIIVEGQMDVITAHQHGFKNVIASSGTALTAEQVVLLKRYTNNIALGFDMDEAGGLAAERGIAQAMQAEMNIKVIEIAGGKDPDECIKRNPDAWKEAVARAKPMMQYYFDKTFAGLDLDRVEGKREAAKIILPVIAKLGNMIERDFWLKKLSQKVDVAENYLREALRDAKGCSRTPKCASHSDTANNSDISARQSREEKLSELLLALMLKFPSLIEYAANYISGDHVEGLANRRIYRNLIIYYNKTINNRAQEEINYQDFKNWLEQNNQILPQGAPEGQAPPESSGAEHALGRLMLLADKDFYNYSQEQAQNEIIKIAAILKSRYLAGRLKEITKLIAQIEKENQSDERLKDLMEEFKALSEEIQEVGN